MCVFLWPGSLIAALATRGTLSYLRGSPIRLSAWHVRFSPIRKSTACLIVLRLAAGLYIFSWHYLLPAPLADADKLNALRRLDQFREWHSWMTNVTVSFAARLLTGRQIQIAGSAGGNGPPGLSCPTERCNSIPMDWALPPDEILAAGERYLRLTSATLLLRGWLIAAGA